MPSRSPSFADRVHVMCGALLVAALGVYSGVNKRTLGRAGGVELGEWSWVFGGGLIALAVTGLIIGWWPTDKPAA